KTRSGPSSERRCEEMTRAALACPPLGGWAREHGDERRRGSRRTAGRRRGRCLRPGGDRDTRPGAPRALPGGVEQRLVDRQRPQRRVPPRVARPYAAALARGG